MIGKVCVRGKDAPVEFCRAPACVAGSVQFVVSMRLSHSWESLPQSTPESSEGVHVKVTRQVDPAHTGYSMERNEYLAKNIGQIQRHGVLLVALRSNLRLIHVSENAERVTGISAAAMLGASLTDCFNPEIASRLAEYRDHKRLTFNANQSHPFSQEAGVIHRFEVHHNEKCVFVEIECDQVVPTVAEQTPTRVRMILDLMRSSKSLQGLLEAVTRGVQDLTGYDRVIVCRFVEGSRALVSAESRRGGMVSLKNLCFAIGDLPSATDSIDLTHPVSVLRDAGADAVPVLSMQSVAGSPIPGLDLTHCSLQCPSDSHLEYLRSMGVAAAVSIVLSAEAEPWGCILCHHAEGCLPSPDVRIACELIGEIASTMIRHRMIADRQVEAAERHRSMRLIAGALQQDGSAVDCLWQVDSCVLKIVRASGALIRLNSQIAPMGRTPDCEVALDLMKSLRSTGSDAPFATECVEDVMPGYEALADKASGVLMLPFPANSQDAILWFRPEVRREIQWGGRALHLTANGRKSRKQRSGDKFTRWRSIEMGHSRAWTEGDLDAAARLCHLIAARTSPDSVQIPRTLKLVEAPARRPGPAEIIREWSRGSGFDTAAVHLIKVDRYHMMQVTLGQRVAEDVMSQIERKAVRIFAGFKSAITRLDSDRFAIVSTGCSVEEAEDLATKINSGLAASFRARQRPFHVTSSVGWAHTSLTKPEELLRAATAALHFAAENSQHSERFSNQLQLMVVEQLQLQQDLYRAVQKKEFSLRYQPIVTIRERKLVGFEALLRWKHPVRGLIGPDSFISAAEEEGLMPAIGRWVLMEAISQIGVWRRISGLPLSVNINVSPQQLVTPDLVSDVTTLLHEGSIPVEAVVVEVTERALLDEAGVANLRKLRSLGVSVAVDDFGVGYSSLASLRELPIDVVKMDQSFVAPIAEDHRARGVAAAILQLAATLNLEVIAEGVETETQSSTLLDLRCQIAQGYLFSVPLAAPEVLHLLENNKGRVPERGLPERIQTPNAA